MAHEITVLLPIDDPSYRRIKSDIRRWLHERDLDYDIMGTLLSDNDRHYVARYHLYDHDAAILFKLTWGGK